MNGLIKDTISELFDRKVIFIYLVITLIAIVITLFSGNVEFNMQSFGSSDTVELEDLGFNVDLGLIKSVNFLLYIFLFLSVMLTAGIIPSMFIKGRADYYLSKPLSRNSLLLKKFFSVLIIYGSLFLGCGLLVYLSGALVHSVFNYNIFLLLALTFGAFFIWLCFSFFFGIITGKAVSTIVYLSIVWFVQFLLSIFHANKAIADFINAEVLIKILEITYYIFPKTGDYYDLTGDIVSGKSIETYMVGYSTLIIAVFILFMTLLIFKKKNY